MARMYHNASSILQGTRKCNSSIEAGRPTTLVRCKRKSQCTILPRRLETYDTARRLLRTQCNCIKFSTHNMYAHTIAVAESDAGLQAFVEYYRSKMTKGGNVDSLVHFDLPPARGKRKQDRHNRRKVRPTNEEGNGAKICKASLQKPIWPVQ